jgi:predicted transposase YbfD/YdcC
VAQVVRIHCHAQIVRQGQVIKETDETRFAVTTFWTAEADPDRLLGIARAHWSIENGQHYRRDRTQDEDRCTVRETVTARNLSLFRSLAIFSFKQQEIAARFRAPGPSQALGHHLPFHPTPT